MRSAAAGSRATRLDRLATPTGQFAILALDHGRSFATAVRPQDPDSLSSDEMLATKRQLVDTLAAEASAILVDPALAAGRASQGPDPQAGLIVGIEDGDYAEAAVSPRLLPGWTVERAAALGADAVKISFTFEGDGDRLPAQRFVRETVRACERAELPLFCEPLVRRRPGGDFGREVLDGIRWFGDLGADVLKIQFPVDTAVEASRDAWADACGRADALSSAPWALLSEGRHFDDFRELLQVACRAGASGFLAGRVIWGEAIVSGSGATAAGRRLSQLRSIASSEGSPWRSHRPSIDPQEETP